MDIPVDAFIRSTNIHHQQQRSINMSKKKTAASAPVIEPSANIRIIKIGTCPSLSGKSELTYQVGHAIAEVGSDSNSGEPSDYNIQFRIYANSSPGYFSQEWVAMSSIQQVFDKIPAGQPISSFALFPLFKGRSQNTPGFLLAALQQEGFVQHMKEQQRCYECIEPSAFMAETVTLIDAGTDLRGEGKAQNKVASSKAASAKSASTKAASKKKVIAGPVPEVDATVAMPDCTGTESASNADPEQSENSQT